MFPSESLSVAKLPLCFCFSRLGDRFLPAFHSFNQIFLMYTHVSSISRISLRQGWNFAHSGVLYIAAVAAKVSTEKVREVGASPSRRCWLDCARLVIDKRRGGGGKEQDAAPLGQVGCSADRDTSEVSQWLNCCFWHRGDGTVPFNRC